MDSKTINRFPIREYLAGMNIYPAKEHGYYGMYHSPFREDSNASMKVDYNKNLWIDFGSNEGGTLIDLVMRIESCSNGEAMRITSIAGLDAPVLLDYLNKRGIDTDMAKQQCKEINYIVNDKAYYGIGFQNMSGGYEIRNPYFKGCIAPKDISHIQQAEKKGTCYLFEGFMDYLSFLTIRNNQNPQLPCTDWQDYIVLNSTANLPKAFSRLADYGYTYCFLDNDAAGRATYKELERELGYRIRDASRHYSDHKDLNDFLCAKKDAGEANLNRRTVTTPQPPMKKNRGLKM